MLNTPLTPAREDVLVIINALEVLSDGIQDDIDHKEAQAHLSGESSLDQSLQLLMQVAHLEQVALVRGRMQPYLEVILEAGSSAHHSE